MKSGSMIILALLSTLQVANLVGILVYFCIALEGGIEKISFAEFAAMSAAELLFAFLLGMGLIWASDDIIKHLHAQIQSEPVKYNVMIYEE